MDIEVILVVIVVGIIIAFHYIQAITSISDELQAIDHTAIVSECVLLTLDGLELTCVQVAASVCIVPGILIIIVLVIVQVLSRNNLEPALAYAGTVLNAVEVSPLSSVLSINAIRGCSTVACSVIVLRCLVNIDRPLSGHCAVLIKLVLLTIDGLALLSIAIRSLYLLTIGLEVEPTALILVIIEYRGNIIISSCLIVCDIHLQPASGHSTIVLAAEVVIAFLEAVTICIINTLCVVLIYPTVQHLAFVIECILLAVYSL